MVHNRLFCTQLRCNLNSKKKFRPETSGNETILADDTDYVRDTERSHDFFKISNDISRAAVQLFLYTEII